MRLHDGHNMYLSNVTSSLVLCVCVSVRVRACMCHTLHSRNISCSTLCQCVHVNTQLCALNTAINTVSVKYAACEHSGQMTDTHLTSTHT